MAEKKHFLDDFENYEVTEDHRPSRFGYFMKWIFFGIILIANAALIFRVCMAEDPKFVKSLSVNDRLRDAYAVSPDDFVIVRQSVYDMYTPDGLYYSTGLFYIPAANQLQVSVRYNVRTADQAMTGTSANNNVVEMLDDIGFFYDLTSIHGNLLEYAKENVTISPDDMRSGDYFAYRLVDSNGNFYEPTTSEKYTRLLYVYHKLTFDGVPAEGADFYVEIYPMFGSTPDYDDVIARMQLYSLERNSDEYKISSSLRKELSK